MKVCNLDRSPMLDIAHVRREGSNLIISGTIMGSMPITCMVTPSEARGFLRLLSFRTLFFLVTMLFRS